MSKKNIKKHEPKKQEPEKEVSFLNKGLIVFDKKAKITLLLLAGMYVFFSFLKLHTSSMSMWEKATGIKSPKSVIAGSPKGIRQDEWMVYTPELIGQVRNGFPVSNTALGAGNVPVIIGLPVKDFTVLLRPNLWPYFIFDVERAFAFSWNYNIFVFLISSFLFFMLITGSNFWISLLGAFFIFISSGIQWWSYWMGANLTNLNFIFISFVYLLFSKDAKALIGAGIILLIFSFSFIAQVYPPWQVPLVYLYALIFIGYLLKKGDMSGIKEKLLLRIGVFSGAALGLIIFGLHHFGLVRETYDILLNTAYPGKRSTSGGDLIDGKLFAGFFDMFMDETHVPSQWLNICEATGFIMVFPIVFYTMIRNYIKAKNFDWLQLTTGVFVLIGVTWVTVGFPDFLSKITLFSMSPAYRTLPIVGVSNCFLLIIFLAGQDSKEKISLPELGFLTLGVFIFAYMTGSNINEATSNYFKPGQVSTVIFLMTALYLLLRYKQFKPCLIGTGVILIGMNLGNLKIHPLTSGLSSILEHPLVKLTSDYKKQDPEARWAIFGSPMISNLLRVNGINFFNGVKNVPLLDDMKILDPSGKDNKIYNRYAHINMLPYIDFKDSVIFKLNENAVVNDNYSIYLDPCSPRLSKLGIKYFLFTYQPKEAEVRCMTPLVTSGIYLYKHN